MERQVYRVIVSGSPTDPDDEGVSGEYLFVVPAGTTAGAAARSVLDLFHRKIGISELDDFAIGVVDAKGRPVVEEEGREPVVAEFLGRT